ncbi:MAG: DoxX family protein [bacterium]
MQPIAQLIARIFLGQIFLLAGLSKIGNVQGTMGYMESMGVPGALVYAVIALEVVGGLAIIFGWFTRISSLALAGFTLLAAVIFHHNFADQMQMILFMKNIAITGGLLLLATHGAGAYSVDNRYQA